MEPKEPIRLREQQQLNQSDQDYVNNLDLNYCEDNHGNIPPFLGLNKDGWSSYYVGATWLKEDSRPLVVLPKYDNIDFIHIFSDALKDDLSSDYFQSAYKINFDAAPISERSLNTVLSPLIVAHYLSVVLRLVKRGLKRNYIIREENLKCKVKGHILTMRNLQKNIICGHAEKTMCRFQEYSLDYPENQIIKRGLLASEWLLKDLQTSDNSLLNITRDLLIHFEGVSSNITPSEVKTTRCDKLHGEYPVAIGLAKQILHRTDYSISGDFGAFHSVPEFAIDMSRIFEFHVLALLRKSFSRQDILFQVYAGIMGRCDYLILSGKVIVDAKYKTLYAKKFTELSNSERDRLRTDIREIAGYARSTQILNKFKITDNQHPTCVIIHPNGKYYTKEELDNATNLLSLAKPLDGIEQFYTIGVTLPLLGQ